MSLSILEGGKGGDDEDEDEEERSVSEKGVEGGGE
jgi:hypothetical protein